MERQDLELFRPRTVNVDESLTQQIGAPDQQASVAYSLPPADRGRDAWLLLIGSFTIEALIWGFAFSYGVFQEYYTGLEIFRGQESRIAVVGTVCSGLLYLFSPVALALYKQFPHRRRQGMVVGLGIMCAGLVGASFSQHVGDMVLTQGVLFAIGGSLVYYPCFLFIDEWFIRRKGFAYGVMWASSGFTGLILPYLFSWCLKTYSFRVTLRMWAITNFLLILLLLPVLKPRLPPSATIHYQRPRITFARDALFLAFFFGSSIESLGYFLPGIYLPTYARSQGFNDKIGTTSLALLNVGSFLGYICGGFLTDRFTTNHLILLSTLGSTLAISLMWGFSSSAALIVIFSLLYGFFGASFVATWPGIIRDIVNRDTTQRTDSSIVFAVFVVGRGIGSALSGPLSQGLLELPRVASSFDFGYGSGYGALILFVGGTALLGVLGPLCEGLIRLM